MFDNDLRDKAFELAQRLGCHQASRMTSVPPATLHRWLRRGGVQTRFKSGKAPIAMGRKPTSAEMAWAAGIFEGEGTISLRRFKQGWVFCYLSIAMTDQDVVNRFASIVGCGRLSVFDHARKRKAHYKTRFDWHLTRHDQVGALLNAFWPWLGQRRRARAMQAKQETSASCGRNRKPWKWGREFEALRRGQKCLEELLDGVTPELEEA